MATKRTTLKERKYMCQLCEKKFTRPSSLACHKYTHTGERPHVCYFPNCGKRFSVRSNLKRHLKVHTKAIRASDADSPADESECHPSPVSVPQHPVRDESLSPSPLLALRRRIASDSVAVPSLGSLNVSAGAQFPESSSNELQPMMMLMLNQQQQPQQQPPHTGNPMPTASSLWSPLSSFSEAPMPLTASVSGVPLLPNQDFLPPSSRSLSSSAVLTFSSASPESSPASISTMAGVDQLLLAKPSTMPFYAEPGPMSLMQTSLLTPISPPFMPAFPAMPAPIHGVSLGDHDLAVPLSAPSTEQMGFNAGYLQQYQNAMSAHQPYQNFMQ
ncbi:hypothetical protein FBU59_000443 [Linderina macrospora]|uniref:Uncharacterized protein n=1 Tax=Linderina macrospora TaxID=4868 RepID=A0ACC1JGL6_9FUNG|nr:hypothetical protein FBU59_000443 [Linderina macrospora]